MDIYEYLKRDHKRVADLFSQFEKAVNPLHKTEIVALITKELTLHAVSEQETFYRILEKYQISKDEVLHGEKEHQEIEDKLEEIVNAKNTNASWDKKVMELKKLVEHHVKEEEGKIFKKAKKVLNKEDAYAIKERMHDYKEKMLQTLPEI